MKKILAMLTIFSILCNVFISPVSATTPNMTEDEYNEAVANIMRNYPSDPAAAEAALAQLDTTLIGEPEITEHYSESNARGTSPTDYVHMVYSFSRGGSGILHLQWSIESKKTETLPGPMDFCSLEWDNTLATYYASSGDGVMTTVKDKNVGIVLFNIEDSKLDNGEFAYGTVEVRPTVNKWIEYGSKFVHTYKTIFISSGSASYDIGPSASLEDDDIALQVEGNFGFSVTVGIGTAKWQIWTDNAVMIS